MGVAGTLYRRHGSLCVHMIPGDKTTKQTSLGIQNSVYQCHSCVVRKRPPGRPSFCTYRWACSHGLQPWQVSNMCMFASDLQLHTLNTAELDATALAYSSAARAYITPAHTLLACALCWTPWQGLHPAACAPGATEHLLDVCRSLGPGAGGVWEGDPPSAPVPVLAEELAILAAIPCQAHQHCLSKHPSLALLAAQWLQGLLAGACQLCQHLHSSPEASLSASFHHCHGSAAR